MNAAIAIGKTEICIVAIQDTILKRMLLDSSQLPDTQKTSFTKGDRFDIISYQRVEGHYKILSSNLKWIGGWYAFADHVKIEDPNVKELITLEQLLAIAPYTATYKLEALIEPLNDAMARYEINTPLRVAHFIAQVAHESDGFNALEEYASGADYEWRDDLGNTQGGDGVRYKGRSLIQVTGRYNYESISKDLEIDFVSNPQSLADPEYAALGAAWFWNRENLNSIADRDDIYKITQRINGGQNGAADRRDYLYKAKIALNL